MLMIMSEFRWERSWLEPCPRLYHYHLSQVRRQASCTLCSCLDCVGCRILSSWPLSLFAWFRSVAIKRFQSQSRKRMIAAPTVPSCSHCTIRLPLSRQAPTVPSGSHCPIRLPLYHQVLTVPSGSHCIVRLPLYHQAPPAPPAPYYVVVGLVSFAATSPLISLQNWKRKLPFPSGVDWNLNDLKQYLVSWTEVKYDCVGSEI